jgi:SPP1 gp7 family putative phage head morphogenesis protein
MSITDRNVWIEQTKAELLRNEKIADDYLKDLFFLYDEAAFDVEKSINTMFARYADNNALSRSEATALLSGQEYRVWRYSLEKYIDEIAEAAKGSKLLLELNTLSAKSRISRQEQLLSNIYRNMMTLANDTSTSLTTLLEDVTRTNYYRTCYDVQRIGGIGFEVAKINEQTIKDIISYPWSQKQFSEAVWDNASKIAALAKQEITLGFIKGSSVQKMAKEINDVMGKGRYVAERLVRTECKSFAGQGKLHAWTEMGIEEYRYIGGTEGSTHCGCADLNNKTFKLSEAEPGVNFPPIHPNCLCIVVPYFKENIFAKRDYDPIKRRIKFETWYEKYAA